MKVPAQSSAASSASRKQKALNREAARQQSDSLQHGFTLPRRDLFKLLGAGVAVGILAPAKLAAQESGRHFFHGRAMPQLISAWLHIAPSGQVTVLTGKVEIGQNARTSLAQQVAEELNEPMARIRLIMGDTARVPFDMGTFGSQTTPVMGRQLRRAAAAAGQVLLQLAAKRWSAPVQNCHAANGRVRYGRRSIGYGALVGGKLLVEKIPSGIALKSPEHWTVAGKSHPKVLGREFVTGAHHYPADQTRPGMQYGKVLRPPAFHARLLKLDSAAAAKIPGVKIIQDGDFVGLTAPAQATAERALARLRARWQTTPQPSGRHLPDYLKAHARPGEARVRETEGTAAAIAAAAIQLRESYSVAYIAHAPLEPRAALAEWQGDHLTVWTGTQRPFGVQQQLMQTFHLPAEKVRVLMPDMGSAYGGKHTGEAAIEAARMARAAGRPVKLIWTREEEFTWAYFRPAGLIEIAAGCSRAGRLTAWSADNYNSGPSSLQTPYAVPHQRTVFHPCDAPLRQGSYRALAATANHFARESAMDELASRLGMDPLEFRLRNLKRPRLRAVFEAAAGHFDWPRKNPEPGHGFGLAGGMEKGGHVAACVEVRIAKDGAIHVLRVVEAFDCGAVVNPDGLRNQIAGAILMGLGGALYEAIHFDHGRILNPRFSQYRVPRFSDLPALEIVLLDRKDLPPAGAGEIPIVAIAPALANAIAHATGRRLRSMPMQPLLNA